MRMRRVASVERQGLVAVCIVLTLLASMDASWMRPRKQIFRGFERPWLTDTVGSLSYLRTRRVSEREQVDPD